MHLFSWSEKDHQGNWLLTTNCTQVTRDTQYSLYSRGKEISRLLHLMHAFHKDFFSNPLFPVSVFPDASSLSPELLLFASFVPLVSLTIPWLKPSLISVAGDGSKGSNRCWIPDHQPLSDWLPVSFPPSISSGRFLSVSCLFRHQVFKCLLFLLQINPVPRQQYASSSPLFPRNWRSGKSCCCELRSPSLLRLLIVFPSWCSPDKEFEGAENV